MDSNTHHSSAQIKTGSNARPVKLGDHFQLVLNWYKRNAKNLAGEEVLTGLHIKNLLEVLGNPIWNNIYHCWEVEQKHMLVLQPYIEHQFDPGRFVYFIEAYNTN